MEEDINKFKMAVISGAAHALRYKDKNPKATEDKIMQHVTDEAEKILKKIDKEL
jgi:hypothetical protein